MKVLVIPDIHLKPNIFDKAEKIDNSKYDKIVCLGDLVDDWGLQNNPNAYEDTLKRVLEFDKAHSDMLWCWGNHDISYLYCLKETGFSYNMIPLVNSYFTKLRNQCEDRLKIIHRIDTVLFSHAGLTEDFVDSLYKARPRAIDTILTKTNKMVEHKNTALRLWADDSPIWTRPQYSPLIVMYKDDVYYQVVGHTPVAQPLETGSVLTLDTFSTYSTGEPIGDCRLVIIDTETHDWTYAD